MYKQVSTHSATCPLRCNGWKSFCSFQTGRDLLVHQTRVARLNRAGLDHTPGPEPVCAWFLSIVRENSKYPKTYMFNSILE